MINIGALLSFILLCNMAHDSLRLLGFPYCLWVYCMELQLYASVLVTNIYRWNKMLHIARKVSKLLKYEVMKGKCFFGCPSF